MPDCEREQFISGKEVRNMSDKPKKEEQPDRKKECIGYLEKAKADVPNASQAVQIKIAICRFILAELGETDKDVRKDVMSAFLETPSWFGASANAMQELDSYVKRAKPSLAEFEA